VGSWEGEKVGGLEEHGAKSIAGIEIWKKWERKRNRLTAHEARRTVKRDEDGNAEVGNRNAAFDKLRRGKGGRVKRQKLRSWEGEKLGKKEHSA
jgi:hypothetical protein